MKSLYFVAVPLIALLASQSAVSQSISYTDAAASGDYTASINPSGGGGTSEAMAVIWYTSRAAFQAAVPGRFHAGEEMQEPQDFAKSDLVFPSDEPLPRCWIDGSYKTQT